MSTLLPFNFCLERQIRFLVRVNKNVWLGDGVIIAPLSLSPINCLSLIFACTFSRSLSQKVYIIINLFYPCQHCYLFTSGEFTFNYWLEEKKIPFLGFVWTKISGSGNHCFSLSLSLSLINYRSFFFCLMLP